MVGLRDNSKGPSGVLKGWEILEQLNDCQGLRGPCCMELCKVGATASGDEQFYGGSNTANARSVGLQHAPNNFRQPHFEVCKRMMCHCTL